MEASAKKIVTPGYHLKPKYDLHGLRRRRTSDGRGHIAGELPLTALIDMFSVLVIYLLMNFSATGDIFFSSKGYPLPKAIKTNVLQTAPLISVVGSTYVLEYPQDSSPKVEDSSSDLSQVSGSLRMQPASGDRRVNIQAHEDATIGSVKRAMAAAVNGGWTNLNFVVDKKN